MGILQIIFHCPWKPASLLSEALLQKYDDFFSIYNRQKELNQSKATSDKAFEQTKATCLSQNILIKSLEQKLQLINLNPERITPNNISRTINIYILPLMGMCQAVNVNIGKFVNPFKGSPKFLQNLTLA